MTTYGGAAALTFITLVVVFARDVRWRGFDVVVAAGMSLFWPVVLVLAILDSGDASKGPGA